MKNRICSALCVFTLLCLLIICGIRNDANNIINIKDGDLPLGAAEDTFGMLDFAKWKSGDYNYKTGNYSDNTKRLCYNDFPKVESGQKYVAHISRDDFHILARVMDKDGKLIASHNLADGDSFIIEENADSLRIGIYQLAEYMTYQKYEDLFAKGFQAFLSETVTNIVQNDIFEMKKFENWQSGDYNHRTGKLTEYKTRLCLKKQQSVVAGQKYEAFLSDKTYHILVREMDINEKVVASHNLQSGDEFEIGSNTVSIKIGIYNSSRDINCGMDYEKYKEFFENGFEAYLFLVDDSAKDSDIIVNDDDIFGMTDISNWRSGNYLYNNGLFKADSTRICLNDYVAVSAGKSYVANVSDSNYHILVREMDVNNKLLNSYNLASGDKFTTASSVSKIGISIYDTKSKTTSFDMYKTLFENGFKATLTLEDGKLEDSTLDDVKSDVVDNSQSTVDKNNDSQTVVDNRTPEQKLRAEILEMLENGEMGTRDISSYKFNFSKVYLLYEDVIKNEGYVPYACTYGVTLGTTKENGIVKTIKMNYMDSGFVSRYQKLKTSIGEAKSRIKDGMLDIEKALVLHDYVVKKTSYSQSVEGYAYASGALANEYSNCSGYTLALMLLLHEEGIECYYISGNNGTHGWVYAILDGEGYFIDATWDDTSARVSGLPDHYFFVRNDNEFKNDSWRKHYQWKSYEVNATSTSTKYTNWFVHDVVSDMYYVDGFWYYWDRNTNTINRARIDGSEMEQLVQGGSSKLKLSGESAGTITYTLDGIEKNYTIK